MDPKDPNFKYILLHHIFEVCSKEPLFVGKVIESATQGVKAFSEAQLETSTKLSFILSQVLDQTTQGFPPFTRREILDRIEPVFRGTDWWKKQPENLINQ